jgi:hypothetical protein
MYQPFPSGSGGNTLLQRAPAPQTVLNAVKLMYAGAALSVISLIVELATSGGNKAAIRKQDPHYTVTQVNNDAKSLLLITIVFAIVYIGLWLLMARMSGAGHNWARIVSSALLLFNTFDVFNAFRGGGIYVMVASAVMWLIGAGAVFLLWRPESGPHFKRQQPEPAAPARPARTRQAR